MINEVRCPSCRKSMKVKSETKTKNCPFCGHRFKVNT